MHQDEGTYIGGLMRCCTASIEELRKDAIQLPEHGDTLDCKYCLSGVKYDANPEERLTSDVVLLPGWRWDEKRMAERTALKAQTTKEIT